MLLFLHLETGVIGGNVLLVLLGAKPKVISKALRHASVAFTMDCYSPIISGMQEEAMALLDGVMPSGVVFKITSPNPSPN